MQPKFKMVRSVQRASIALLVSCVAATLALTGCSKSRGEVHERVVGPCHSDVADAEHAGTASPEHKPSETPKTENCEMDRVRDDAERKRMEQYAASHVPASTIVTSLRLKSGE